MATFSVKNFEQFQHYKDRSPPWIKLYNDLLDNYEFACLQDASKLHLIMIWLLASRSDNDLPYDPEWIGKRINATEKVNLQVLADSGFILINQPLHNEGQDASNTLADRKQLARLETEGEKRERQRPAKKCPKDFSVTDELKSWAIDNRIAVDLKTETDKFRDYEFKTPKSDWSAAWRNWMRKANEMPGSTKTSKPSKEFPA